MSSREASLLFHAAVSQMMVSTDSLQDRLARVFVESHLFLLDQSVLPKALAKKFSSLNAALKDKVQIVESTSAMDDDTASKWIHEILDIYEQL